MMKMLGIKGGYDSYANRKSDRADLSAASISATDGRLLVERGPVVEEWGPEGRIGVSLVWDFQKDNLDQLAEMMSVDAPLYSGNLKAHRMDIEALWVPGQKRKVVVICPGVSSEDFWTGLFGLHEMAEGACELHYQSRLRGSEMPHQYTKIFSGVFTSATIKTTTEAIVTPHGLRIEVAKAWGREGIEPWLKVVGFDLEQVTLKGPLGSRNRTALSMASAFWASRNWQELLPTLTEPPQDHEWAEKVAMMGAIPELLVTSKVGRLAVKKSEIKRPPALGDMIACNACSLFDHCRLARTGAICAIPESDMGELAEFFKTRDATKIIDGLGELLGKQADRVDQRMADEAQIMGDDDASVSAKRYVSEDVTKMIHGLFDRGVKLAKLTDPRLNGGPKVAVNLTSNSVSAIQQGNPQQLAAAVVAELEARGVRREDITPSLIARELGMGDQDVITEALLVPSDPILGTLPERL